MCKTPPTDTHTLSPCVCVCVCVCLSVCLSACTRARFHSLAHTAHLFNTNDSVDKLYLTTVTCWQTVFNHPPTNYWPVSDLDLDSSIVIVPANRKAVGVKVTSCLSDDVWLRVRQVKFDGCQHHWRWINYSVAVKFCSLLNLYNLRLNTVTSIKSKRIIYGDNKLLFKTIFGSAIKAANQFEAKVSVLELRGDIIYIIIGNFTILILASRDTIVHSRSFTK